MLNSESVGTPGKALSCEQHVLVSARLLLSLDCAYGSRHLVTGCEICTCPGPGVSGHLRTGPGKWRREGIRLLRRGKSLPEFWAKAKEARTNERRKADKQKTTKKTERSRGGLMPS